MKTNWFKPLPWVCIVSIGLICLKHGLVVFTMVEYWLGMVQYILDWWRLTDLSPPLAELTFRSYNLAIKHIFYQKGPLRLNGCADTNDDDGVCQRCQEKEFEILMFYLPGINFFLFSKHESTVKRFSASYVLGMFGGWAAWKKCILMKKVDSDGALKLVMLLLLFPAYCILN